jgi:hypothetical protein
MDFDIKLVAQYVREADTEELLDRVTVFRDGMEPEAIDLMEGELGRRGVKYDDIVAHREKRGERVLTHADGIAMRCSLCERPAVSRKWGWHRLYGRIPVFPRKFAYCETHDPQSPGETDPDADLKDDDKPV